MNREPLLKASFWVSLTTAAIALAVAAGLDMSTELQAAILGLVAVLAPVVTALWARGQVTPAADPRDGQGRALQVGE